MPVLIYILSYNPFENCLVGKPGLSFSLFNISFAGSRLTGLAL